MKKKFFYFYLIIFLVSCQSNKLFYIKDGSKGYTDGKIGEELYKVTVSGESYKNKNKMIEIFMLRCAEIAKENKYPYFYTVNKIEYLTTKDKGSKPYSITKYSLTLYEKVKLEGYVKFLKKFENPQIPYPIKSTEKVYKRMYYLIKEKQQIFGIKENNK